MVMQVQDARAQLLKKIDEEAAAGNIVKGPGYDVIADTNGYKFVELYRACLNMFMSKTGKTEDECAALIPGAMVGYFNSLNKDWKGIPTLAARITDRYLKDKEIQKATKSPEPAPAPHPIIEPQPQPQPQQLAPRILKGYRTIVYKGKLYTCTPDYEALKAMIAMHEDTYLWGPAGTGKTMMVEVAAWELGMDFYIQTAPQEDYELVGKEFANGTYEPSPFVLGFTSRDQQSSFWMNPTDHGQRS